MVLSWLPLAALGLGAVIALIFRKRKAVRK
ncbi:MAG: hypothetical protein FWC55_05285 [Firmicutes bacterium]|nr:hypothetical protein [Bacillota bacterium]